jgi:cell wall assembly regulator SMI1
MAEYSFRRAEAARLGDSRLSPDVGPNDLWHPAWLPMFVIDSGIVLVLDCAHAQNAPVRRVDGQDFGDEYFARVLAPSLGQFVGEILDAIAGGHWRYDPAWGDWRRAAPA